MKTIEHFIESYVESLRSSAPPPPLAKLKQLLSREFGEERSAREAPTPAAMSPVPSWWDRLRDLLPSGANEPSSGELRAFGSAHGKDFVARKSTLGVIPAALLREHGTSNEAEITLVAVLQRPRVSEDGRLVVGIQVPKHSLVAGERLGLVLLAVHDSLPIGPSIPVAAGDAVVLDIALTPELKAAWRGLEQWEWAKLPFRFQLTRQSEGDHVAAGRQFRGGTEDNVRCLSLWIVVARRLGKRLRAHA